VGAAQILPGIKAVGAPQKVNAADFLIVAQAAVQRLSRQIRHWRHAVVNFFCHLYTPVPVVSWSLTHSIDEESFGVVYS
jgi:hypothetical protein